MNSQPFLKAADSPNSHHAQSTNSNGGRIAIEKELEKLNEQIRRDDDIPVTKEFVLYLLNIIEEQAQANARLKEENQKLKDEINRLKGEKGKPKFKGSSKPKDKPKNYQFKDKEKDSSEKSESAKKDKKEIKIDRTKVVKVDQSVLPDDTGARVNGVNHYFTILGSPLSCVFFLNPRKNRPTVKACLDTINQRPLILVCDDAGQFKYLTKYIQLCWIHEIRHYIKLIPILEINRTILDEFISRLYGYYHQLQEYKKTPSQDFKEKLLRDFDALFATKTSYDELNHRINLTQHKKDNLLTVLDFPEIPIHNNSGENDLREYAVKRKISIGPKSIQGQQAWTGYMSLLGTCNKLDVNFYDYLVDLIKGEKRMPRLSESILARGPT